MPNKEATLYWPGYKSTGRRAVDFVKCVDPECERNKSHQRANAWRRRNGYEEQTQEPHCHPVF